MTKEELKQEFEKYLKDSEDYYDPREPLTERKLLQMWLDCAEPREKRIAELEAQVEKMKNCHNCKHWHWKHERCEKKAKGDCFKQSKWELAE